MVLTDRPQFQIIEDSPTVNYVTSCGFISVDNDVKSTKRKIGFALVEVDPDILGFNVFNVWELASLPLDIRIVHDYILAVNEQKLIQRLHIDMENFIWFNGKGEWNQSIRNYLAAKEREKKDFHNDFSNKRKPFYFAKPPALRALGENLGEPERGKDPLFRQIATLEGTFARGEIRLASHLKDNQQVTMELSRLGSSVVCDALAGAIYKAKDLQKNLRNQFNYNLVERSLLN